MDDIRKELYQQVILDHNKNPKNFKQIDNATHSAEGYNPLCGDHLHIYIYIDNHKVIQDIGFKGDGCAISKASASMMTSFLKGKTTDDFEVIFDQFHKLITGALNPDKDPNTLGKLSIFSGLWHFPARVKCASLCWHTMRGAIQKEKSISTE